jgi:hypothetical protein
MAGEALDVMVSGSHAYVTNGSHPYIGEPGAWGLQVVDVSNPAAPEILGSASTPSSAVSVALSGSYAYVADDGFGVLVVDISDPASPTTVGSIGTPGSAHGVAVSENYVYVADGTFGLQVAATQCEGAVGVNTVSNGPLPTRLLLETTFPNPFVAATTIDYALPASSSARLALYDLQGRRVALLIDRFQAAGRYSLKWDGRNTAGRRIAPGVYFLRLKSGDEVASRKIVLLR